MKKDLFKSISEKLKTDKKTRVAVITSAVGAVLVLTAAVTIPVALHNRVKVEADAESAAITVEAVVTESASAAVTEPETEAVSEISTEPTTAETTAQAANNESNGKKANNTSKSSGGADSSAKKPNGGGSNNGSSNGGQAQQKPPVQNEEPVQQRENYDWSQAEVDALIAEAYAYGRTLGLEPATNLTPDNSSWRQPVCTWLGKQSTIDGVKGQIKNIRRLCDKEGVDPTGIPCYQIYAERYYEAAAGGYCWQFYVMS